jgi:hypothetical protein
MRRWLAILLTIFVYAGYRAGASAAGVEDLGRFLGTWTSPGTLLDTPYSKAGSASATTTCAWSSDHVFMICQQITMLNGKPGNALSIYTYDAAKSQYHFFNLGPDGGDGSIVTVTGDTVTYTNSFTDKAKEVTIRTLNIWSRPDFYRWRTEYTTDSGKTWMLMASGTSERHSVSP